MYAIFSRICKNKARRIWWKINNYDKYNPEINKVKYLELIGQDKTWLLFNTASKVCKSPGHASIHPYYNFLLKFQISKVHTLNFRNMKFEPNCFYIGGVDTYPVQSVAILFNPTVHFEEHCWLGLGQNRLFWC